MSILGKAREATEAYLDSIIAKSKSSSVIQNQDADVPRKSIIELGVPDEEQMGYKERSGLVGPTVLKNMARKDSVIIAIINTKLAQIHPFLKEQKDQYSPGWVIKPKKPADLSDEDKMQLADPMLQEDEEAYAQLKFELEQKRMELKGKQDKAIEKIKEFIKHSGQPPEETDTTKKRWDFDKVVKSLVLDRLVYNCIAVELIPTKDSEKLHHYYPVSAGTIRYVTEQTANKEFKAQLEKIAEQKFKVNPRFDKNKPFRYVQVVRGRIVAAFTEDELIYEFGSPTIDPEDNGYAQGELEQLIGIVTAHLYAEAHNRNFFTQGIGTKGILHIKGDNISRAQLEAFKRQWFNQVVNSRNAFRPPIIGMAEDVKWVSLAQTNQEMEFEKWMNYLIKIACAIFQIDPSEINFDISKTNTSTLQEANNEEKLKASKDKGLKPLLDFIQSIINNHILRYWDPKLADDYEFEFVGFDAESRKAEQERLKNETSVWKTLNEARIEMGFPPIEHGDIVLNATYTQYIAQKEMANQPQEGMPGEEEESEDPADQDQDTGLSSELDSFNSDLQDALDEKDDKKEQAKKDAEKDVKKSQEPTVVEYYLKDEGDDE